MGHEYADLRICVCVCVCELFQFNDLASELESHSNLVPRSCPRSLSASKVKALKSRHVDEEVGREKSYRLLSGDPSFGESGGEVGERLVR